MPAESATAAAALAEDLSDLTVSPTRVIRADCAYVDEIEALGEETLRTMHEQFPLALPAWAKVAKRFDYLGGRPLIEAILSSG